MGLFLEGSMDTVYHVLEDNTGRFCHIGRRLGVPDSFRETHLSLAA